MSFFARASWPGDHRDEIVAGALVAAVIVVLGYASGIGAPVPTTVDSAPPPTSGAPTSPGPSEGSATGNSGVPGGSWDSGTGSAGGSWGSGGAGFPVVNDTPPPGGHGGHGSGGAGSTPGPAPPDSPSPTPSPTAPDGCEEGEVRLAQPLLNGAVKPVTGLLDGLLGTDPSVVTASPSPSPSSPPAAGLSSVCVGTAPSPSVIPEVLP